MLLSSLIPFFLENKIDSYESLPPAPWSRIFYNNKLEELEKCCQSALCLKLCFALYSAVVSKSERLCYFVIIPSHRISASTRTLALPTFFPPLGHVICSKANKILLDDSYYLYPGMFFLLLLSFS